MVTCALQVEISAKVRFILFCFGDDLRPWTQRLQNPWRELPPTNHVALVSRHAIAGQPCCLLPWGRAWKFRLCLNFTSLCGALLEQNMRVLFPRQDMSPTNGRPSVKIWLRHASLSVLTRQKSVKHKINGDKLSCEDSIFQMGLCRHLCPARKGVKHHPNTRAHRFIAFLPSYTRKTPNTKGAISCEQNEWIVKTSNTEVLGSQTDALLKWCTPSFEIKLLEKPLDKFHWPFAASKLTLMSNNGNNLQTLFRKRLFNCMWISLHVTHLSSRVEKAENKPVLLPIVPKQTKHMKVIQCPKEIANLLQKRVNAIAVCCQFGYNFHKTINNTRQQPEKLHWPLWNQTRKIARLQSVKVADYRLQLQLAQMNRQCHKGICFRPTELLFQDQP